ncbi:hypothetical protein RhiJN_27195 [Ceratobasidium sp. AG-Ba]|nr:hypothetical protein RhiJN_27195 [Ceratobasidium sp. AG-Ba]
MHLGDYPNFQLDQARLTTCTSGDRDRVRILQNLERATTGSPAPRDIARHFENCDLALLWQEALGLVAGLREDVARSRQYLQRSLRSRQAALNNEVRRLHKANISSEALAALSSETPETVGLPRDKETLEEMYNMISHRLHKEENEFEQTMEHIEITAILGDFDSDDEDMESTNILDGIAQVERRITPDRAKVPLPAIQPELQVSDEGALRPSRRKSLKTAGYEEAIAALKSKLHWKRC